MGNVVTTGAPAKLNLTLEVIERLPSGYHNIRSVMVKLDAISDTIELRIDPSSQGVGVTADSREIPVDRSNICHRAAAKFLAAIDTVARVDIHIGKVIPVAAGLGGGSSDAAAVLQGLNQDFGSPLSSNDLSLIGSQIGKDIPFFLTRAPAAVVSGLGETVEPLPVFPDFGFLIVNPGISISTQAAYESLAHRVCFMSDRARIDVTGVMVQAIASGNRRAVAATLYNDFETHVERQHPVVRELKQALVAFGATGALMSGSGPTVFGLFESVDQLRVAEQALRRYYPSFIIRSG